MRIARYFFVLLLTGVFVVFTSGQSLRGLSLSELFVKQAVDGDTASGETALPLIIHNIPDVENNAGYTYRGKEYVYLKTVRAKVTAYEPSYRSCGKFADGRTATGKNAWIMNGCAVAPDAIPYGTVIDIPGVGKRIADDTGSAMKKSWRNGIYHIDVRFSSFAEARKWGVKMVDIDLYVQKYAR